MTDKDETCVVVTVYNLAEGRGFIIGDSVAIPEPYLNLVSLDFKGKVRIFFIEDKLNLTVFDYADF
jgi:hypothetical protein